MSEAERHLLMIERLPGAEATMVIDGKPVRVVRIRVTPDQTEVLYEVISGE